ncbi:MAG: tRNA (adenosine(37)-N6)-dimethylallyltransferase MiaA [Cellvibrionales bacterium]|nr:tRNA (adenosine(37)-N6)-dimethylallyltransferase MiaA [Cellvibrionales bacterium]
MTANPKPPVVFIMGPTTAGKTDLAIWLAQQRPVTLISVDSAMVYRGLDIGTAKPSPATLRQYPHQLVDIRDPAASYSAADFARDARRAIAAAHAEGRLPILVGGTALYFRVLLDGIAPLPTADPALRAQLAARAARDGWPALHRELAQVDPETAARLHPQHSQRIQRALEVHALTGQPLSALHRQQQQQTPGSFATQYDLRQLALLPRLRQRLHARIEARLSVMFSRGLVAEAQRLYERGDLHPELSAMRTVGYRQLWPFFAGEYDLEEARNRVAAATRQLAKRQLTWLRRWPGLSVLHLEDAKDRPMERAQLHAQAWKMLNLPPL